MSIYAININDIDVDAIVVSLIVDLYTVTPQPCIILLINKTYMPTLIHINHKFYHLKKHICVH